MEQNIDGRLSRLREKAQKLPLSPGVYIMENSANRVIYVGKSRCLRNRVYQYFVGTHDPKTERMASSVHDFRFIVCTTEMEALALENSLIKRHSPRYNIKLKDAKSYPYLKFTADEYPRLEVTRTRSKDGGTYFGPYSGIGVAYTVRETLERVFGIPSCKKKFPEELGRGRPCMYYQTGRCMGLCTGDISREEYLHTVNAAKEILRGRTSAVISMLEERMMNCAMEERFEEAARCRDAIEAVGRLGERHQAVGAPDTECDVISFAAVGGSECAAVFYVRSGFISDSEHFVFGDVAITGSVATGSDETSVSDEGDSPLSAFIMSLYQGREYIPKTVLISHGIGEEDLSVLEEYLTGLAGHKVTVRVPVRGDGKKLCELAAEDAVRHLENSKDRMRREEKVLFELARLLSLEVIPERIEAYDISNYGSEHITAGMVVYEGGRPKKKDYRYFRIETTEGQDDYGSMREALRRRFAHLTDDEGAFSVMPDLLLIDGGETHVAVVNELLREIGVDVPVCGMVKDSHHKTRALVTEKGTVSIARREDIFRFIYGVQEEVHRFTVSRMTAAKRKTMRRSSLEDIPGIGPAKAKALLSHFGKLSSLKVADVETISKVKGISMSDAENVHNHFRKK